jgi:hypothetical protein
MDRDNGFAMASGQPAPGAFPKEMPSLLLGLSAKMNLDGDMLENQILSSELILLPNCSNGALAAITSPPWENWGSTRGAACCFRRR